MDEGKYAVKIVNLVKINEWIENRTEEDTNFLINEEHYFDKLRSLADSFMYITTYTNATAHKFVVIMNPVTSELVLISPKLIESYYENFVPEGFEDSVITDSENSD